MASGGGPFAVALLHPVFDQPVFTSGCEGLRAKVLSQTYFGMWFSPTGVTKCCCLGDGIILPDLYSRLGDGIVLPLAACRSGILARWSEEER